MKDEASAFERVDLTRGEIHLMPQRIGSAAIQRERRPGCDMDLLVHRVHRVLRQRLDVLGAAERAQPSDAGVDHLKIGAVALSEQGALDVGGLELAALEDDFARCR